MARRKNGKPLTQHGGIYAGSRYRGAAEARIPEPTTAYHESEDVGARAREEGRRETLDLLYRIKMAGSDKRALQAIRAGLP